MSLGQCNPQSKILWHLDRVRQWQKTGTTRPIIFEIDPSNKCNQNCPWCSFSKLRSESKDMMCYDQMKILLDSLHKMGVKAVNWTGGGEPLVNPDTEESVRYANFLGFDQGMFTNGLLLKKEVANVLAPIMTWIRISVDGYDGTSYAENHGTSEKSFNLVIDNIHYLCTRPNRCTVGVGFIMTENNYKGAEKLARIAKKVGADYIQFKPVVFRKPCQQLDPELLRRMSNRAKTIRSIYETDKFKVMVTDYRFNDLMDRENNNGRMYSKCLSHHFQGAIGADSKVYLCDHHKGEPEYELGSLKDNTLEEIWESDKRKEVIRALDKTDLSQCIDCCRNHELNKFLWHTQNPDKSMHPNHI